jgi:hypothetical protein
MPWPIEGLQKLTGCLEKLMVEREVPALEPETPAVEPEAPALEPEAPAVEPEAPALEPEVPVVKPELSVVKCEFPVVESEAPVVGRRPSVLSRIRELACEAIAACTTEDHRWASVRQIQKYFAEYSDVEPCRVRRNLASVLRELERQGILVRLHTSVTFLSAETADLAVPPRRRRRKRKRNSDEARRNLGPDVVLTSSGRISYRPPD